MVGAAAAPNIVRDFTVGHTRIKIADDFCRDMTGEDVKKALREIARTAKQSLTAAAVREAWRS